MSTGIKTIAFIGATGMLGKPVAIELAKAGYKVKALVRDKQSALKVLPVGIELVEGDMKNEADLRNLLKEADGLYLNLSVKPTDKPTDWHSEADGLKMLLPIAKAAGIKRISMISSIVMHYQGMNNFHWWVFDIKHAAVKMIKDYGIPYTLFYPSTFFESIDGPGKRGNTLNGIGKMKYPVWMIAGADYGKQVAKAFELESSANKDYWVQGPEALDFAQAGERFVKACTKEPLKTATAPMMLFKILGLFVRPMNYISKIMEALNNYPEKFVSQPTWDELGKPNMKIEDYAKQASK